MSKNRRCTTPFCGRAMNFLGEEQIQLGQTGIVFGHLSNLLSGSLDVEIWECPGCGKIDFYRQTRSDDEEYEEGHMAQTTCPDCGHVHDLDDPKCPRCGAKNPNI